MKESKRRKNVSGAVLIMVLTVMFVLIILLTATLSTVTTANKRIYTKFEENQAYYTARSALDVFTQNMLVDKSHIAYKYNATSQTAGAAIPYTHGDGINTDLMKQGLGLQLDLYSITSQSGHNIKQNDLRTYANAVKANAAIPATDKKDEYINYFGIEPSGTAINEIKYEVTFPKVSKGSSSFGKMADKNTATIKVEVLDRRYNVGYYTDASSNQIQLDNANKDDIDDFFNKSGSYSTVTDNMIAEAIATGSRKKDTMRVKITALTVFDGVEGSSILIVDSNEPPANNSSKAITAFGGTGSDNFSIVGGMAAQGIVDWGTNLGFIYGSVYAEDDFKCPNGGPKVHVNEGESIYIGGNLELSNNNFEVINDTSPVLLDDEKSPFVYVGGKLITGGGINNSPFNNVDIIAHGLVFKDKIVTSSSGNIYCIGDFEFGDFSNPWGGSNATLNGDIYVSGDVRMKTNNDFQIVDDGSGNFTLRSFGGSGHIFYAGSLTTINAAGNTVPLNVDPSIADQVIVLDAGDKAKIDALPSVTDINNQEAEDTEIELDLPARAKNKKLKTHTDNYSTYYVKDEDGKVEVPVTVITSQTMADIDTMGDKTKPFTSADTGITTDIDTLLTHNNEIVFTENFQYTLDTAGANVKCVLNSGSSKRNGIHITGGGTVELLVSGSYSNETKILVDDDTTLKFIGDTTSNKLEFAKLWVYNQTTLEAFKTSASLNVGDKSGCGIKVPKIHYYISGTNDFYIQTDALLTGYVYAPDALLEFSAAHAGQTDIKYNSNSIGSKDLAIIGSALCKGVKLPNNAGVAYINPNLDDDTPGDPIHQWQTYQYVRN